MNALVVEDDAISRIALVTKLQIFGFDISEVETGEDAIMAVEAVLKDDKEFELICLDINLPGINGDEVLARVRQLEVEYNIKKENAAKILIVTSVKDIERMMNLFDIECDGYLTKPVTIENVKTHLEQLGFIVADCEKENRMSVN